MSNYKSTLTRQIGERVLVDGHLIEVQESQLCDECYLNPADKCRDSKFMNKLGFCSSQYRMDGISVIFKEVKS